MSAATLLLAAVATLGVPPDATREIEHLRDYLSESDCAFYRNGTWHDAARARKHLDRKYRHLVARDLIARAEDFIARAASRSETTGLAYRVRCGDAAPVDASRWFGDELERFRTDARRWRPFPARGGEEARRHERLWSPCRLAHAVRACRSGTGPGR